MILLGTAITATATNGIYVAQGLILNDWSGLHPYYRAFQIPIIIAVGYSIGVFEIFVLRIMKKTLPNEGYGCFKIGLILGLVGISNLLHPYIDSVLTDYLVILVVFFISLAVAIEIGVSVKTPVINPDK